MGEKTDRALDVLEEAPLLAQDEAPHLRVPEIGARFGLAYQSLTVSFVCCETVECDQPPSNVIAALVWQEVADERAASARKELPPALGIVGKFRSLERIDPVPNETAGFSDHRRGCCRNGGKQRLLGSDAPQG